MLVDYERVRRARLCELEMIRYRKRVYGLTQSGYAELVALHGGVCAICGEAPAGTLNIDHDHATGAVRGLLCENCNRALGLFRDSPDRLRAAANYLEEAPRFALENTPDVRRPTYRDVAERLGVHVATVQRVFTKPHKVDEDTRSRVMAVATELGVTPGRRYRVGGVPS